MLGDFIVEIGPANIPGWVLFCIGSFVAVVVVEYLAFGDDRAVWSRVNDLFATTAIVAILGWKLTPIVTRFSEANGDLRRLLYMPGGTAGVVVGAIAALAAGSIGVWHLVKVTAPDEKKRLVHFAVMPAVALIVALVSAVIVGQIATSAHAGEERLPTVALSMINGDELDLGAASSPTLLVFWATWCGPCAGQMPELQRIHDRFEDDATIVAVNLTRTESDIDLVHSYISDGGYTFPVALDTTGQIQRIFRVGGTPTTLVYDSENLVRHRRVGAVASTWMAARLLPFVE